MNKKILVVDDEKDIVAMARMILEKSGYTVITAFDGNEGYATALSQTPDLIISDVVMPGKTGLELLKAVKLSNATKNIPFILLTQKDSFEDIYQGYGLGASNYLPKPFDAQILLQAVRQFLDETE